MKNPFKALKGWSTREFVGSKEAEGWSKALKGNKKLHISNPSSKRWWIQGDDYQPYTTDQIEKSGEYPEIEVDTFTGSASGPIDDANVDSTAVKEIKYDPKTKELLITYTSGDVEYSFPDVPKEVVEEFMRAPSKGKYLANVIQPRYSINYRR